MATKSHEWTEPRRTGNADILCGHLAAMLVDQKNGLNYAVEIDGGLSNPMHVLNVETGNRYRVTVEQVEGVE